MQNPSYEQALDRQGVEYVYIEQVDISDIDVAKSLANQARLLSPLDPELVEAYRLADADGREFPALVTWRPGKGKQVLIDGNHRLAAKLKNGRKTVDVYFVDCTDRQIIDRITWKFNNDVNGRRLSFEEAMEHAITFVRKYGMKPNQAAVEWGVNLNTLTDKVRILDTRDTLAKNEVKITPVMTDDVLRRISSLKQVGEDVMTKVAQVVGTVGPTRDEVDDLIRDVRKAKGLEEKMSTIDSFAASEQAKMRKAETKGGTVKIANDGPRNRYVRLLRELAHHGEDHPSVDALRPYSAEMDKCREYAASIIEKMLDVFGNKILSGARNGHEMKHRNKEGA